MIHLDAVGLCLPATLGGDVLDANGLNPAGDDGSHIE
jgi:hypothetical protein